MTKEQVVEWLRGMKLHSVYADWYEMAASMVDNSRYAFDDEPVEYNIDEAIRLAGLWRAGKMIGGDQDAVCNALLAEVERLRSAVEPTADAHNPRDLQEIRFLESLVEGEYGKNFRQWYYWEGGEDGYTAQRVEADDTAPLQYPPLNRTCNDG